jgi:DNA-binding GntR family transcriptional regulator
LLRDLINRLDATAREEMAAELDSHAATLRGLRAGDREGFTAEVDRHLLRVAEILLAHSRRHPARLG